MGGDGSLEESLREKALQRLAGLDMKNALDVKGTGLIDGTVLTRSLKIFDSVVFTDESVPAILAALGATPRGANFSIEEISTLVDLATGGFGALDKDGDGVISKEEFMQAEAAEEPDEVSVKALYEEASQEPGVIGGEVKKKDVVKVLKRALVVARMVSVRKPSSSVDMQPAVDEAHGVAHKVLQGVESLDDEAPLSFQDLQRIYAERSMSTSGLEKLAPEPVKGATVRAAPVEEEPPEVVEELIVAGKIQAAADAIIAAEYLSSPKAKVKHAHVREIFEHCAPSADGKVRKNTLMKALKNSAKVIGFIGAKATQGQKVYEETANEVIGNLFAHLSDPDDDMELTFDDMIVMCQDDE